jgi:hypothetical protein
LISKAFSKKNGNPLKMEIENWIDQFKGENNNYFVIIKMAEVPIVPHMNAIIEVPLAQNAIIEVLLAHNAINEVPLAQKCHKNGCAYCTRWLARCIWEKGLLLIACKCIGDPNFKGLAHTSTKYRYIYIYHVICCNKIYMAI